MSILFLEVKGVTLTPNCVRKSTPPSAISQRQHNRGPTPEAFVDELDKVVWADVLALDMVGIEDDFFDLGGDSLSASRIIARVLERFQLDIPMSQLFNSPTIAHMAAVITAHQDKTLDEHALAALLNELESLSEVEAVRILAEQQKTSKV
jgi:acyl carrier protein